MLSNEIAKTEESWDPESFFAVAGEIGTIRMQFLSLTSLFLEARDEKDGHKQYALFEQLVEKLFENDLLGHKECVSADLLMKLLKSYLNGDKRGVSPHLYKVSVAQMFALIGYLIETKLWTRYTDVIKKNVNSTLLERHTHMVEKTAAYHKEGKRALINGGVIHVCEGPESSLTLMDARKIEYVSLLPIDKVDVASHQGNTTREQIRDFRRLSKKEFSKNPDLNMKYCHLAYPVLHEETQLCLKEYNALRVQIPVMGQA